MQQHNRKRHDESAKKHKCEICPDKSGFLLFLSVFSTDISLSFLVVKLYYNSLCLSVRPSVTLHIHILHISTKFHQDLPNNWGARSIPRFLGFHDILNSYLKWRLKFSGIEYVYILHISNKFLWDMLIGYTASSLLV